MESPETSEPPAAPLRTAFTAQALLVSPEISLPLSFATGHQSNIVAASAGDVSLVVWVETDASGTPDIRGMRVRKSDGALLDATPLCIACTPGFEISPSVASNGTDFLVSWTYFHGPTLQRTMSVRVRGSDGAVLGPSLVLRDAPLINHNSAVASDGSDYLVVWKGFDELICENPRRMCGYFPRIYGARVSSVNGSSSFISLPNSGIDDNGADRPRVTYGGGNYLVTWSGSPTHSNNPNIYTLRIRASDGLAVDSAPRLLASGGSLSMAAFDGSRFLVVWTTPGGEIRAGRLGQDGAVLDPGGFLVSAGNTPTATNVLFDGTDYRVTWEQGLELVRPLKGVRVTRDGRVVSGSETVFAESSYRWSTTFSFTPALAALGPGRFLLGHTRYVAPSVLVKLRVVEDLSLGMACTRDAQCQSGSCVDGVCCESACGGGSANDCQACSVAAGGAVDGTCGAVRADAAVVCRPSAVACDVAEVCDGASTVCPGDEPSTSEPDLSGDKCEDTPCDVAAYVAALGSETLAQPFGQSLQAKAGAACQSWEQGNAKATQGQLRALLNEVRAQGGKKLSPSAADTLSAALGRMLAWP
jgi:hypothetical protein